MELNELFEKYSIEEISQKTNIPKEKLESLKEQKWEAFRKPQLIGFLHILEREFKVDLNSTIEEVKEYFKEHAVERAIASIDMVDSTVSSEHKGYFVTKLIYLLTIIALGYAGWYYYNREAYPRIEANDANSSIVSDTINSVKNLLGMDSAKALQAPKEPQEQNSSVPKAEPKATIVVSEQNESDSKPKEQSQEEPKKQKFDITTSDEPQANNTKADSTELNSSPASKQESTQDTLKEPQEPQKEDTNSIKQAVDTLLEENDSLRQAAAKANNTKETLTLTKSNSSEENSSQDSVANTLNQEENSTLSQEENTSEANNTVASVESATIVSTAKSLWLGIYNLDTKKRATKIVRRAKPFEVDLNKGNYAIVTGHNRVKVQIGQEEKSFPKKGRVYFLLSKENGLEELSKAEYRKLTKRRAW